MSIFNISNFANFVKVDFRILHFFVPLDKVYALGRAKINEIYFAICSRFCTFVGR